jgi:hypothetical protein
MGEAGALAGGWARGGGALARGALERLKGWRAARMMAVVRSGSAEMKEPGELVCEGGWSLKFQGTDELEVTGGRGLR